MRSSPIAFCLALSFFLLCIPCIELLANPIPAFYDGDFTNWTYDVLLESGIGDGSMTRESTGGNGGAFLSVSTQSGWGTAMWVVMWSMDAFWEPATGGPIDSLAFIIEEKEIASAGDGQNIKLAVIQGGTTYLAPLTPWLTGSGTGTTWQPVIFAAVTADDFARIPPWPYDAAQKPNFSASGGPITFGFMAGVSSVLDPRVHGYDNYELIIYTAVTAVDPGVESSSWSGVKTLYR